VWNRQRTDHDLVDPANITLGHRQVQRWNLPAGWVISASPAHPALVSEADFIAVQDASAPRGPAGPAARRYLLAGLLQCGVCGRRLESAWSNGKPAYRCRHGHTSATRPNPGRPKNLYICEDKILPRLAAVAILHADGVSPPANSKPSPAAITPPAQAADLIDHLRCSPARRRCWTGCSTCSWSPRCGLVRGDDASAWVRAHADPVVGHALRLLHHNPAHP
jgi:site-specific DNA recombinase